MKSPKKPPLMKESLVNKKEKLKERIVELGSYDLMFANVFQFAVGAMEIALQEMDLATDEAVFLVWGIKLNNTQTMSVIQMKLRNLLTQTPINKFVVKSEELKFSTSFMEAILATTVDIIEPKVTLFQKKRAIQFLLLEIFMRSLRYSDRNEMTVEVPEEKGNEGALYYVVGATLRALQSSKDGCRLFNAFSCDKTHPDCVELKTRKWTEMQDRGGLVYASKTTFQFFNRLHSIAKELFCKKNNQQFDRKEKIFNLMKNDEEIKAFWNEALRKCDIDSTVGDKIFDQMINKLVNTEGNGHVRSEKDDMMTVQRAKNQKARAKKALRKHLEEIRN